MAKYLLKWTLNGTPKTGLTPTVDTYIKLADGTDVVPVPTIAEAKNGLYIMTATPTELIGMRIDGGAGVTVAAERYKFLLIGPNDYFADASISSRANGADYTQARAAKIDQLDAAVTSRAAAADYTQARAAKLDQLDAAISTRAAAADYTQTRAAKLDNLDAAISTRGTGDATASSQLVILNAINSISTALASIPAAVWDYLSGLGNRVLSNFATFFQNAGAATSNKVDNVTIIQEQQAGARVITITVVNSDGDPVPDVEVQLYTNSGTPAGTRGRTNPSGQMTTSIDDGQYVISAYKAFFDADPLSITVDSTHTTFEMEGVEWSRDAAALGYQTIYGDALTLGPAAAAGDIISVKPARNSMLLGNSIINPALQKATVANDGTWQIQVRKGSSIILEASTGDLTYYTHKIDVVSQDNERALSSYPKG